jgi:hypothetical protein
MAIAFLSFSPWCPWAGVKIRKGVAFLLAEGRDLHLYPSGRFEPLSTFTTKSFYHNKFFYAGHVDFWAGGPGSLFLEKRGKGISNRPGGFKAGAGAAINIWLKV